MKGIIFTEFLELVEKKFGLAMVDEIIQNSNLKSQGVYTAIGTYEFSEMLSLITHLSKATKLSIDDLLLVYAEHLFAALINSYPDLVSHYQSPMDLLASIENHIHVEVKKIYTDAELPSFETIHRSEGKMELIYRSSRALYMLGKGLMEESFKLFNVQATITYQKIKDDGTEVAFTIIEN